jgi:pyruvate kinase
MHSGQTKVPQRSPRFELVATLGPASWNSSRALIEAGATALRINTSHAAIDEVREALDRIHHESPSIRLVVDLQGAKMRLGHIADRLVARGDLITFALDAALQGAVPLPHSEFFEQVAPSDTLRIDDDRLRFRVTERGEGTATAVALGDGVLRARKGVNLLEHPVLLRGFSAKDRALCALAAEHEPAACAISFMTDGHEALWAREAAPSCPVIGKVERREAVESLDAVDAVVDEVWICRGDLGAQLGVVSLARWMGQFDPSHLRHPVLVAGQVFEHLTAHAAPTRSEACHLYDLWARGYAGVVLSDETAIGADPERAVRVVNALVEGFSV